MSANGALIRAGGLEAVTRVGSVQVAAECAAFLALCPSIQPPPKQLFEAALLVQSAPFQLRPTTSAP